MKGLCTLADLRDAMLLQRLVFVDHGIASNVKMFLLCDFAFHTGIAKSYIFI